MIAIIRFLRGSTGLCHFMHLKRSSSLALSLSSAAHLMQWGSFDFAIWKLQFHPVQNRFKGKISNTDFFENS